MLLLFGSAFIYLDTPPCERADEQLEEERLLCCKHSHRRSGGRKGGSSCGQIVTDLTGAPVPVYNI